MNFDNLVALQAQAFYRRVECAINDQKGNTEFRGNRIEDATETLISKMCALWALKEDLNG